MTGKLPACWLASTLLEGAFLAAGVGLDGVGLAAGGFGKRGGFEAGIGGRERFAVRSGGRVGFEAGVWR